MLSHGDAIHGIILYNKTLFLLALTPTTSFTGVQTLYMTQHAIQFKTHEEII